MIAVIGSTGCRENTKMYKPNGKACALLLLLGSAGALSVANAVTVAVAQEASGTVEAPANPYLPEAAGGIATLQSWYVPDTGLYQSTGWWTSANVVTVLADFMKASGSNTYLPVLRNTFVQAQKLHAGFLNNFYDDEGWWALAWIDAYDLTGDEQYLAMAQSIFDDMAGGWDSTTCGGGIWWSKDRTYKNAIANELFLSVAGQLAGRVGDLKLKGSDVAWAQAEWQWFNHSGMINRGNSINDGLNSSNPSHCVNNGQAVWSYNQGVVLGGLVALHNVVPADSTLLPAAKAIADAALLHLTDANGVLHDQGEANGGANGGGVLFKGIFVRNLVVLDQQFQKSQYTKFFTTNAASIWNDARGGNDQFGQVWSGPYAGASPSSQASALDTLIAAAELAKP